MASASPVRRVPSEERVFSLVLALVASPQGLTKSDLLSSVYGYAERYDPARPDPSIERQFERDKSQVRQMGIPIEAIDAPLESGNNQLTRYRISKDRLQLPDDVRFTSQELMLLKLASLAWSDGSLGAESRWATMKLTSLGVNLDVRYLGVSPSIGILEPAAPALQAAIDEARIAKFYYQLPGRTEPLERRIAPLRLHRAEGRWHLIAYDLERESYRVFLLSRIASEVRVEPSCFDQALFAGVESELTDLLALSATQRAVVAATRGSAAEARLGSRGQVTIGGDPADETTSIDFGTLDFHALASELAGYGDDVQVLSPESLRADVARILEIVLKQHSDIDHE